MEPELKSSKKSNLALPLEALTAIELPKYMYRVVPAEGMEGTFIHRLALEGGILSLNPERQKSDSIAVCESNIGTVGLRLCEIKGWTEHRVNLVCREGCTTRIRYRECAAICPSRIQPRGRLPEAEGNEQEKANDNQQ
jgi:hypothetical protein